ncbi:MAG: ribosome biogenesis GTP-binding protein YsxC, partial [Myxococcales bacterium]|nr:ribosome biogenesis GTP-binding protein YsxC [Myxococcales bacterium]
MQAAFVAGAASVDGLPPPTTLEIAFAGRSNVGKSSLLNALMQRNGLARTSRTPGCTRQLNVFEVRCADGLNVRFVDLPGYGWARRSKSERHEWQGMIEGYLLRRVALRAVVLLFDVRRGVEDEERQLVEFLASERERGERGQRGERGGRGRAASGGSRPRLATIWVATKVDKVASSKRKPALDAVRSGVEAGAWGVSKSEGTSATEATAGDA